MPASPPFAPAPPGDDARVDVRAEVRRTHAAVIVFYLVDAVLLGVLGAIGTVELDLGLWYAAAGCAVSELAFHVFRQRGARAGDFEALGLALTASTAVLMLATLARAPQVGGLMLMSMMSLLALSAVHLSSRHQLVLCVVLATASAIVLPAHPAGAGVPTAGIAERIVSAVWLAWLMAKGSAHNVAGTRLRQQVNKANARLAEALQSLEKVASVDELTLLPNRRAILADVERAVAARQRRQQPVAIAMIDIDGFKLINDSRGHEVGDHVLRDFGRVVAVGLRPSDRIGRYGGEEFLLVLREFADDHAATDVVERLRAALVGHDWSRIAPGLAVTASAGVALLLPGEDGAGAIRRADAALYEAKQRGRNRVVAASARPLLAAPA